MNDKNSHVPNMVAINRVRNRIEKRFMPKRNIAWIFIVFIIALVMWQLPQTIANRDALLRSFGPIVAARTTIEQHAVREVNDQNISSAAVDAAINAMVAELNDPYAIYLNPEQYVAFQTKVAGHYGGIGVEVCGAENGLEILNRAAESPAMEAGLLPGDIIVAIDGVELIDIPPVDSVNNMLNGVIGSEVALQIERTDAEAGSTQTLTVTLTRADITLEPIRGWRRNADGGWDYLLDPAQQIGYVRLVKFTPDIDEQLFAVVRPLISQGLKGLILDLRENSGGLLDSAWEIADMFLADGLIVKTAGRNSPPQQWFAKAEGTLPAVRLAVLINGASASASEIISGSLRDHQRAKTFGTRTFGKGSVQEVIPLGETGGAIKLTTRYYYLPSGVCIHRHVNDGPDDEWGVIPDRPVKLTDAQHRQWRDAWRRSAREPASVEDELSFEQLIELDRCLSAAVQFLQSPKSATN